MRSVAPDAPPAPTAPVPAARSLSTRAKVAVTVLTVTAAAAVAGVGTYGLFTDTTSADAPISAGTVDIELGAGGGLNELTTAAADLLPGDDVQRAVDLSNVGTGDLSGVTLSVAGQGAGTALYTDATNGLQLSVQSCSTGWTGSTASGYTCTATGGPTTLVTSPVASASALGLGALNALHSQGIDHLLVRLALPTTADNTFQGLSSTLTFTFDATQTTTPTHR
jgi:spore coat-associated protein N